MNSTQTATEHVLTQFKNLIPTYAVMTIFTKEDHTILFIGKELITLYFTPFN